MNHAVLGKKRIKTLKIHENNGFIVFFEEKLNLSKENPIKYFVELAINQLHFATVLAIGLR